MNAAAGMPQLQRSSAQRAASHPPVPGSGIISKLTTFISSAPAPSIPKGSMNDESPPKFSIASMNY